jgi:hypothetical protein
MTENNKNRDRNNAFYFSIIGAVTIVGFWKIFLINDVIWDDNCWLQSVYATNSLREFLDTGFMQMRRPLVGGYLYSLFTLHRYTDFFYPVWHALSLLTQFITAVFLFLLARDLFKDTRFALLASLFFLTYHLDQTLPYASASNYRIGLALSTVSLYLTVRAFAQGTRWTLLSAAALCAILAHSVFVELAIALEPGRFALIAYGLHKQGMQGRKLLAGSLARWAPFLVLAIPLIVFKLTAKPYGIYAGSYGTDPWFFLEWRQTLREIKGLIYSDWFSLRKLSRYADLLSFTAFFIMIAVFVYVLINVRGSPSATSATRNNSRRSSRAGTIARPSETTIVFIIALLFLLPPLLMVRFAGMHFSLLGAQDNPHAIFAQIGLALLVAHIAVLLLNWSRKKKVWIKNSCMLAVAGLLGLGVYYNNIVLDLFRDSSQRQIIFWKKFTDRFPALPAKADFLFDVDEREPYSDLRIFFDFEVHLNLLYSRSVSDSEFRRYRVFTMEEYRNTAIARKTARLDDSPIERHTQWGPETLDPKEFVVIRYRDGMLLANEEIRQHQKYNLVIPYENWLDGKISVPPISGDYPLRYKVPGFQKQKIRGNPVTRELRLHGNRTISLRTMSYIP